MKHHSPPPWACVSASWDGCEPGEINYTIAMSEPVASKANARLIEAAPYLLEACRMMLAAEESDARGPEFRREINAAKLAARQAIFHATGESG